MNPPCPGYICFIGLFWGPCFSLPLTIRNGFESGPTYYWTIRDSGSAAVGRDFRAHPRRACWVRRDG